MSKNQPKHPKAARRTLRLEKRLDNLCAEEDKRKRQLESVHERIESLRTELAVLKPVASTPEGSPAAVEGAPETSVADAAPAQQSAADAPAQETAAPAATVRARTRRAKAGAEPKS